MQKDSNQPDSILYIQESLLSQDNNNLYHSKIKTWTIYDVQKRNIAKQNNINYIEFYNIEECKSWINNYETKNN